VLPGLGEIGVAKEPDMNLLNKLLRRGTGELVAWIDVSELAGLLKTECPPLIVDVRGPGEFVGPLGHIDSAENIPLDQIPGRTGDLMAEQRPLVLVCHTDRRSSAAADHLRRAGREDIAVLRGGMVAWRSMP
jgi:rhodanese-related sulfurtransferase